MKHFKCTKRTTFNLTFHKFDCFDPADRVVTFKNNYLRNILINIAYHTTVWYKIDKDLLLPINTVKLSYEIL